MADDTKEHLAYIANRLRNGLRSDKMKGKNLSLRRRKDRWSGTPHGKIP
jgi:hypothetical protein